MSNRGGLVDRKTSIRDGLIGGIEKGISPLTRYLGVEVSLLIRGVAVLKSRFPYQFVSSVKPPVIALKVNYEIIMPHYPEHKRTIIDYPQAPSGKIEITKWEPPFVPVENGYGFIGVIAEDVETGDLQCHICGKWFQLLSGHITKAHNMETCDPYRERFGLFKSTALKSKRLRLLQSDTIRKLKKAGKMNTGNNFKGALFVKGNKYCGNRKGWKKPVEGANKYGRCDLQIMTKIIELSKEMGGKTPSLVDIKERYGGGLIAVMHSRYGSYVKYCREKLKMEPLRSVANPWTKKQWREHLLDVGRQAVLEDKPMTVKGLLPVKESRYVYKFFKNFEDYKSKLFE